MGDYIYAFLVSIGVMTVLDNPNWTAALAFYLIFILGVTIFVVYPGWDLERSLLHIGLLGALFGIVTYATYDLTNQATIKDWPIIVTAVDMVWGAVLTSAVSMVSVLILKTFLK